MEHPTIQAASANSTLRHALPVFAGMVTFSLLFQLIYFFFRQRNVHLELGQSLQISRLLCHLLECRQLADFEGMVRWALDVRLDAGTFPAGFGDWVDRPGIRHVDHE